MMTALDGSGERALFAVFRLGELDVARCHLDDERFLRIHLVELMRQCAFRDVGLSHLFSLSRPVFRLSRWLFCECIELSDWLSYQNYVVGVRYPTWVPKNKLACQVCAVLAKHTKPCMNPINVKKQRLGLRGGISDHHAQCNENLGPFGGVVGETVESIGLKQHLKGVFRAHVCYWVLIDQDIQELEAGRARVSQTGHSKLNRADGPRHILVALS
jgi:hypothetical protein